MPRFSDEWLIDRTLFDYVQGGSCACCSFANFMPGGTAGLIQSLSELETDAAQREIDGLQTLPWPTAMKDQVWMERVRLRQKLKKDQATYRDFWKYHGQAYSEWLSTLPPQRLAQIFQLPRQEITERLKQDYNIHAAFGTVLCAVVEQVAHFKMTGYPPDGRGGAEVQFESVLAFDKRGGFGIQGLTAKIGKEDTETGDSTVLQIWLDRHRTLGGPKLLERAPPTRCQTGDGQEQGEEDDEGDADAAQEEPTYASKSEAGPSFRHDRRIIRWVIAKIWADILQSTFLKETQQPTET